MFWSGYAYFWRNPLISKAARCVRGFLVQFCVTSGALRLLVGLYVMIAVLVLQQHWVFAIAHLVNAKLTALGLFRLFGIFKRFGIFGPYKAGNPGLKGEG